jgi:DNA-binding response OmpR family regulator
VSDTPHAAPASDTRPPRGATPLVLVIEDDTDIRELVTTRLTRLGYEVVPTATGEAGLLELDRRRPDLLVLDVLLPGIDGWEVLRRIRQEDATRNVPVLVLSIAGNEPPNDDIAPGEYLPKPFAARRFTAAVQRLLSPGGTP